jgi:hypothetical protein
MFPLPSETGFPSMVAQPVYERPFTPYRTPKRNPLTFASPLKRDRKMNQKPKLKRVPFEHLKRKHKLLEKEVSFFLEFSDLEKICEDFNDVFYESTAFNQNQNITTDYEEGMDLFSCFF